MRTGCLWGGTVPIPRCGWFGGPAACRIQIQALHFDKHQAHRSGDIVNVTLRGPRSPGTPALFPVQTS